MGVTEFTATVSGSPDGARILCTGDLNVRADAAMETAYADAAALGARQITLEFGQVGYINSTGIALIVRLLTAARADGRTVRAMGLTAHYRHLFEITRLSDYMEILDDAPIGAAATARGEGA
jgi:anti-sigma B factor antagonist